MSTTRNRTLSTRLRDYTIELPARKRRQPVSEEDTSDESVVSPPLAPDSARCTIAEHYEDGEHFLEMECTPREPNESVASPPLTFPAVAHVRPPGLEGRTIMDLRHLNFGEKKPIREEPVLVELWDWQCQRLESIIGEMVAKKTKSASAELIHSWIKQGLATGRVSIPDTYECVVAQKQLTEKGSLADSAWFTYQIASGYVTMPVAFLIFLEYGKHGLTFPANGSHREQAIVDAEKLLYAANYQARKEYNAMCANLGRCIRELGWGIITYPGTMDHIKGTAFRRMTPGRVEELKGLLSSAETDDLYRRSTLVEDFISHD